MSRRLLTTLMLGIATAGAVAAPIDAGSGSDRAGAWSFMGVEFGSSTAALAEELARLVAERPTRWSGVLSGDAATTSADQAAWLRAFSKHVGGDFRAAVRVLDDDALAAVVSAVRQAIAGATGASGGQTAASPSGGSFAGGGTGVIGDGSEDWDGLADIRPDQHPPVEVVPTPVPLPSGAVLGLAGLIAVGSRRRRSL